MASPFSARRPPCVLRIRNSGSRSLAGSQPIPALWVKPKRFPEGSRSSISGVNGSAPAGPGAWVATRVRLRSGDSRTDSSEMVVMGKPPFRKLNCRSRPQGTYLRRPDLARAGEAVKKSKQSLAKAPSRKGREAQVSCFLCDLCGLAPLREHVFALRQILSHLRTPALRFRRISPGE